MISFSPALQRTAEIALSHCTPVLYIDRGVIVLNKPSGLVCQVDSRSKAKHIDERNDLSNLLNQLRNDFSLNCTPYSVHRLDKRTTGSLILARSASLARDLSQQFQQRSIEKTYLALVRGGEKSFPSKSGRITSPIHYSDGRASLDPSQCGKPSITDWELVASSPIVPLSLLRLRLQTGHKHQLRVHMAHCLKAPILGDKLYSKNPVSESITHLVGVPEDRVFLHASQISLFRYRASGPNKRFRLSVSAPLPEDFLSICTVSKIHVNLDEAKGGLFVDGVYIGGGKLPEVGGYWTQ